MTDLVPLLQEFHQEKLNLLVRHQATARLLTQYDVNNTYQYVINREEAHLSWVAQALAELGAAPTATTLPEPDRRGRATVAEAGKRAMDEDAREAQAFVDHWRPRIDAMSNARHARMLRLILGEVLEERRFFEQALAGRTDLLGRRGPQVGAAFGEVLPDRWIE